MITIWRGTAAIVLLFVSSVLAWPQSQPAIFIDAAPDFSPAIAAALLKKKDPVKIVTDKTTADFFLSAAPVYSKPESTGSKVTRCLFLDCIGIEGWASVSVELIRSKDGSVVWAYQVRKDNAGPVGIQSMSEAIAKHLKSDYLDKQK